MALSTASGPWRSVGGFIVPIISVSASDIVDGEFQIPYAGARILILSQADGGPTGSVDFILPEVTLLPGKTQYVGPNAAASARPEFNGIEGSITNYGADRDYMLKGFNGQPVSGQAGGVTIGQGKVVQWACNGNPNAPWLAISTSILVA